MWKTTSPNGKLSLSVEMNENNALVYTVSIDGKKVLESSTMGLETSLGSFAQNPVFIREEHGQIKEQYSLPASKKAVYTNHANEMSLFFEQYRFKFIVDAKAFDDGVAFRYRINEKTMPVTISRENTSFVFSQEFEDMWLQDWVDTYEGPYNHTSWSDVEKKHFGMPCLFHAKKEGYWVLITEAGILNTGGSYCSSHLLGGGNTTMTLDFAPEQTGPIQTTLPFATPWRVVHVTENLNDLVNSTIIYNLNPKSMLKDTSWIKTGRNIWSWWSFENGAQLYSEQKKYVDFAAAMGFESITVDAGWDDTWVEDLCTYAVERGVTVWLWSDMQAVDTFEKASEKIPRWASWGVVGLKVDFFMNDSQHTMWQYNMIADLMTQNKLMINFHGSTKPAGEGRTWPNLMTEEGIMGLEHYKWSGMPNAVHNCTVPFTRNVVGPMDYTVTGISNLNKNTTQGHQLAMSLVFDSGTQHLADSIYSYEPWIGTEFLRRTYGHYDEVKLLDGYPGDYVVMLRRKEDEWFVGAMVGTARSITLDLSFLPNDNYTAVLFSDGENGDLLTREAIDLNGRKSLTVDVLGNGGFALYISDGTIPLRGGVRQGYMDSRLECFYPQETGFSGGAVFVPCVSCVKGLMVELGQNGQVQFDSIPSKDDVRKTLRLYYSASEIVELAVVVNGVEAKNITLEPSGSGQTMRAADAVICLNKGENTITLRQNGETQIALDHIRVIEYVPHPEAYYPAHLGVTEGTAQLLPVPYKAIEKSIQGIGAEGAVVFSQVQTEVDGEYILLLDYYSGENRYLQVCVNQQPAITTVLFNSSGWGPSRWDILARKEVKITLRKGLNTIRLQGFDTDGPHIGQIGIRLETVKPVQA